MLVRELVVGLRLATNRSSFRQGNGIMNAFAKGIAAFAGFQGVATIVNQLSSTVKLASDSRETLNLLKETFKEFSTETIEWSKTMGDEMQRSSFQLQRFASMMQSILVPMLGGDAFRAEAAEMSKTLTEKAIDLASFFNTTDQEALRALQSGIAGEIEPLRRRFGISATQKALAEFAGIKSILGISEAEKTRLRFQFIMARSTDALGDAKRTAHEYAQTVRRLQSRFEELKVTIGLDVLPIMTDMQGRLADNAKELTGFFERTNAVKAIVGSLGLVLGALAGKLLLWKPALVLLAGGWTLAAAALVIFASEVHALMDDDIDGVFERWGNALIRAANPEHFVPEQSAFVRFLRWVAKLVADLDHSLAHMFRLLIDFNNWLGRGMADAIVNVVPKEGFGELENRLQPFIKRRRAGTGFLATRSQKEQAAADAEALRTFRITAENPFQVAPAAPAQAPQFNMEFHITNTSEGPMDEGQSLMLAKQVQEVLQPSLDQTLASFPPG